MESSLGISFSNSSSSSRERRWVHLTQPVESEADKTATMFDISQMIARARSGMSAHTYKKPTCTSAGVSDTGINVRLDFEAWPSSPDLPYTLSANIGNISLPIIVQEYTEFSAVFKKSDRVDLDFAMESISDNSWETGLYKPDGTRIWTPIEITLDGFSTLRVPEPIFAVARIRGRKIGARHTVQTRLITSIPVRPEEPIPEEGISAEDLESYWAYTDILTWNGDLVDPTDIVNLSGLSLSNLHIVITAKWINTEGEEESESMPLTIPQCVQDLLSKCGEESGNISGTDLCTIPPGEKYLTVYTSGCTGKVIEKEWTSSESKSWCE